MSGRKRKASDSSNNEPESKYLCTKNLSKQLLIPLERYDQKEINNNEIDINRSFENMPTELLLKIFSYLSYTERKIISIVCKKWRIICSDPLLNRYCTVGPQMPLIKVKEMLQDAPYLKNFRVVLRKDLKTIFNTLSRHNTKIINMKIEKCLECKVNTFIQLSKSCPCLRTLAINNTIISCGRSFRLNNELFENLQKLTTINSCIHHNKSYINNDNVPLTTIFLIKLLKKCKNLKYIKVSLSELQHNALNDDFVSELCKSTDYKLIGLCLDASRLTAEAIAKISMCKNLKVLKLISADQITVRSIEIIQKISTLRTLHLTNVKRIGRTLWKSLFSQPWMANLQSLNLTGCKRIDDTVLKVIGQTCKSLTHLNLNKCRLITGDGLAAIITGCTKLSNLYIKSTQRKVANNLLLIPQHLNKLKLLSCEEKHINKHIKKKLTTLCPNLQIQ